MISVIIFANITANDSGYIKFGILKSLSCPPNVIFLVTVSSILRTFP
ncbi:hypothetical protein FVB9532_03587 [Mesonia oceanica]|uniref:Uncharacterized protein n=1 Tax=Mesonia oceanica TaxID=2687242 RepID=A0AC61YD35_9FLAO|nr:hypothetical protein FVB9532_03587 [Mesonia oceanica]